MVDESVVWIVDDEPGPRESLSAFVTALGHRPIACSSAEDFLARQEEMDQPGVVLCDLCMGGMSGLDLQEKLGVDSLLSFVMITGFAKVSTAVTTMQRGALTLLEKPYSKESLRDFVAAGIQLSQQRFAARRRRELARERLAVLKVDQLTFVATMLAFKRNKDLADFWNVSVRTIERRRPAILKLVDVESEIELAELIRDAEIELPDLIDPTGQE